MPSRESLAALLEYVRQQRGIDFSDYKDTTLRRRLKKRLDARGTSDYAAYLDVLQTSPDEFEPLLDTLFINVTAFFRDPDAWKVLDRHLADRLESGAAPIRVWCAGVASGEEAYSAAMLIAERLGIEQYRQRVKIYATDIDDDALVQARHGTYTEVRLENVPEPLREKYVERSGQHFAFRADLRRSLIFGRHDLLQDAPISRLDLLICRNTLMYFNREAQDRILDRFHFALKDFGLMFLGQAEMMLSRRHLFEPLDGGARVFGKAEQLSLRERMGLLAQAGESTGPAERLAEQVRLRDLAYEAMPVPQILVGADGRLALANAAARDALGINQQDVGRPFQDLELSYRPVELRSHVERTHVNGAPTLLQAVPRHSPDGAVAWIDIDIRSLRDDGGSPVAASITFMDVTRVNELNVQLEHSRNELESAYEQLQSASEELETTNEELQSTIEEMETTNEELQSTNEELQSTNEELETMNEELQSSNEEMAAINEELRERSDAFARLNAYMTSILDSVRGSIVVLDESSRVRMWNSNTEELWGLRGEEVAGEMFLGLDFGLPVEQLAPDIRACLRGDGHVAERTLDSARDRRGRPVTCRVTCSPLLGPDSTVAGTILVMEAQTVESAGG